MVFVPVAPFLFRGLMGILVSMCVCNEFDFIPILAQWQPNPFGAENNYFNKYKLVREIKAELHFCFVVKDTDMVVYCF